MARTHGRPSTYNNAGCRCPACTAAVTAYRARRRAAGFDRPKRVSRQQQPVRPSTIETREAS